MSHVDLPIKAVAVARLLAQGFARPRGTTCGTLALRGTRSLIKTMSAPRRTVALYPCRPSPLEVIGNLHRVLAIERP
jgi:hypothetical protein